MEENPNEREKQETLFESHRHNQANRTFAIAIIIQTYPTYSAALVFSFMLRQLIKILNDSLYWVSVTSHTMAFFLEKAKLWKNWTFSNSIDTLKGFESKQLEWLIF